MKRILGLKFASWEDSSIFYVSDFKNLMVLTSFELL